MEYTNKIWYKQWWGAMVIIGSAIILFFLAASAVYFAGEIKNTKLKLSQAGPTSQPASPAGGLAESGQKYEAAGGDHYWLGSANAKITIVEFCDFACPNCLSAFSTIREIGFKYKNDIKFIWRDYPVYSEYSGDLAAAGRCAGEQGLFWPMHDKLFQNQGVNSAEQLLSLANQIGADVPRFSDCLNKQKYLPQIQKDLSDGLAYGVTVGDTGGTPTYFINGYKIAGDIPYDVFVKIIEELKK